MGSCRNDLTVGRAGRLVILGASGDLAARYLLPALAELSEQRCLPEDFSVVGVARDRWDDTRFRAHAAARLAEHAADVDPSAQADTVARLRFVRGDAGDPGVVRRAIDGVESPVAIYLALPPAVFPTAIDAVAAAGLPAQSRIVVEKPFGQDLDSARALNARLHDTFVESAVFRIDHFLHKQTVQNLLGLRFANRLFEPLWCAEHVERVDIVWDETVALEGRAGYYDHSGALSDMVQNHLLQLLSLAAMDQPEGLDEQRLRDAKVAALQAVRRLDRAAVRRQTIRGQYLAGRVEGREIPDYTAEDGVDPTRDTETFAEVTLFVDNERWRGVPFRLRTGKALQRNRREIAIRFHPVDHLAFGQPADPQPNQLVLQIDPDEVILDVALNGAGDPFQLDHVQLDLALPAQEQSAYARVLLDVIDGDAALTIRADEAEESWRIVEPILDAWDHGVVDLRTYRAGSLGPDAPQGET